jgi:hypothetical protein
VGALEVAGERAAELNQIDLSVSGQVQELLLPAIELARRRRLRDQLDRREAGLHRHLVVLRFDRHRAEVALIEPPLRLLGQDTGNPFPVQVHHW